MQSFKSACFNTKIKSEFFFLSHNTTAVLYIVMNTQLTGLIQILDYSMQFHFSVNEK